MVNNTPRKKRHFCRNIIIVMAFAVLLAGGAFAAARNAHAKAHTHSYRWVTKKNATCKETGYRNYECACGSILNSQTIDKTPHTWNRGSANCTTAKKCTYCGYIAEAAKGHNLTWVTKKAASCTETGYRNYECHCGYVKNSATIDKIPHTWNRGSADCTHDKVCNVCGTIGEAAKGHRTTWVTKKAASCTETGYRNLECPCGYVQSSATIDKTPHNWNRGSADCTNDKVCRDCRTVGEAAKGHSYSWVVKTAASCTTDGLKEHRCACGAVDETKVIDKWGHHYDIPSASCTEDQKCTTCGDIKEYAKGHNWDRPAATCTLPKKCLRCGKIGEAATGQHVGTQWVVVVEPTCHSGGVKEWRCDCGHSLDGCDIPSNNNHNWVVDHTEPGNCVAWGSTYYRCTNDGCKQTKREANIPPTGHANRRWVVTKEPTKTADGVESYICEYCDDVAETRTLYLISYVANGGKNIPGNQTKRAGIDLTLDTARPTRSGYTFKGWGTTTAEVDYQPGAIYSDNKRTNLYAIWDPNKYQVGYNANGGVGAPPGQTKFHGVSLTLSDVIPTRDDYVFVGWAEGSATATKANYSAGGTYSKNASVTLYAVWAPDKFNVKYNLKGGKNPNNDNAFSTRTYDYGTNVRISSVAPTRTGYTFKGWDTSSKATKVVYDPGDLYTAYRTVTLYAVWEANEYTLTIYSYNKCGNNYVKETKTVHYDEEVVLPQTDFNLPGKCFVGWGLTENASQAGWKPGEKLKIAGNTSVYPVFGAMADEIPTTHDLSGYQRVVGLNSTFVIAKDGRDGTYGADQRDFAEDTDLLWEMYRNVYGNKAELNLANVLLFDNDLINHLRGKGYYDDVHTYLMGSKYVVNGTPTLQANGIFEEMDQYFGNNTITSCIKRYYIELAEQQKLEGETEEENRRTVKRYMSGSCGVFAAVNAYMYLATERYGHGVEWSYDDIKAEVWDYLKLSNGNMDWLERLVSGGDGPVSLKKYLANRLSGHGCSTNWREFSVDRYELIKSSLSNGIPVILAFDRRTKGNKLTFYDLESDTLSRYYACNGHYFVVTGVYEKPGSDKHFLEVSTWGGKRYICFEEYAYKNDKLGISLFSTLLEIKLKN